MPPRAKVTKKRTAESGKRYPLNMRTTFEVRTKLEEAAKRSGRSLAQEAEYRLQHASDREDFLAETLTLAFGPEIAELLRNAKMDAWAFFHNCAANIPGNGLIFWRDAQSQLRSRLLSRLTDEQVAGLGENRTVIVQREEKDGK